MFFDFITFALVLLWFRFSLCSVGMRRARRGRRGGVGGPAFVAGELRDIKLRGEARSRIWESWRTSFVDVEQKEDKRTQRGSRASGGRGSRGPSAEEQTPVHTLRDEDVLDFYDLLGIAELRDHKPVIVDTSSSEPEEPKEEIVLFEPTMARVREQADLAPPESAIDTDEDGGETEALIASMSALELDSAEYQDFIDRELKRHVQSYARKHKGQMPSQDMQMGMEEGIKSAIGQARAIKAHRERERLQKQKDKQEQERRKQEQQEREKQKQQEQKYGGARDKGSKKSSLNTEKTIGPPSPFQDRQSGAAAAAVPHDPHRKFGSELAIDRDGFKIPAPRPPQRSSSKGKMVVVLEGEAVVVTETEDEKEVEKPDRDGDIAMSSSDSKPTRSAARLNKSVRGHFAS